jgi:hypothetical protein
MWMNGFVKLYTDRLRPSIQATVMFPEKLTVAGKRVVADRLCAATSTRRRIQKTL